MMRYTLDILKALLIGSLGICITLITGAILYKFTIDLVLKILK